MPRNKIILKIADITIALGYSKELDFSKKNPLKFRNFIGQGENKADIELDVQKVNALPALKNSRCIFKTIHPVNKDINWALFRNKDGSALKCSSDNRETLLFIDKQFVNLKLLILKRKQEVNFEDIFDALQIALIEYLGQRGGVLIHSAGLIDSDKKGKLFIGQTRFGKSTTARIWAKNSKAMILNDDRIIVRKIGEDFFMYPTPWHGDFYEYLFEKQNRSKLDKIFFIRHGKENSSKRVSLNGGFNLFYPNTFPPFWDREGLSSTVVLLEDILKFVPAYSLGFVPDKSIIKFTRDIN